MRLFQVEKGRLAVECPPEITKHLMDIEVIIIFKLRQQYDTLITCIYQCGQCQTILDPTR